MSTTPRTDKQAIREITTDGTWIAHSRTLERELVTITAERDQLRAELAAEREKVRELSLCNKTGAKRLAHQSAQLAAERARLDWIESRASTVFCHCAVAGWSIKEDRINALDILAIYNCQNLRAAIDAAIKEDAK
jgi:hypothetical protein